MNELVQTTLTAELVPAEHDADFAIIHGKIFNATSSMSDWSAMFSSAIAAHRKMCEAGQENFKIDVQAGGSPSMQQIARNAFDACLRMAAACVTARKPEWKLTEDEKFAICVASRVPLVTDRSKGLVLRSRTAVPCRIVWNDAATEYEVYQLRE